jgi:predicted nucleic acid-binding protein
MAAIRVLAARAWRLRENPSIYDGSHVALAELTDATLIALDRRLGAAPGSRRDVTTPESGG